MDAKNKFDNLHFFEKAASHVTNASGSNAAIVFAFSIVLFWLICGPIVNYSEQWQLIINTSTTIITFLMVFLIQKSQNKDALAMHLKLNELVAAHELASNRLVDIENMSEQELKVIQKYYSKLSTFIRNEVNLQQSHSIDEVEVDHDIKRDMEKELIEKLINFPPEKPQE